MHKTIMSGLDKYLSIKNGYFFWKHLVPFFVVALLFIILSPQKNIFLRLLNQIEELNRIWIAIYVLIFILAGYVYTRSVKTQLSRAYLLPDTDNRRTIVTSFFYFILCTLIAYGVLALVSCQLISSGSIAVCPLIAVLSLTGIGWSIPDGWVKLIGIKSPDYTNARQHLKMLVKILNDVGKLPFGETEHIRSFLGAAEGLKKEIEKNLEREPDWAKPELERIKVQICILIQQTETCFSTEDLSAVRRFPLACNCKGEFDFPEFIGAIKTLSNYWDNFQCPERRS